MTNEKLNNILSVIAEKSKKIFGEKLDSIILYGSYARGDYDEQSDVDIMIIADVFRQDINKYFENLLDLSSDLGLENDVVISICIRDLQTFNKFYSVLPFYQTVLKEGVKVA